MTKAQMNKSDDAYISDVSFDEERALYGRERLILNNVSFTGAADGESALKEARNICCKSCFFNLRYPLWHVTNLEVTDSEMTPNCRAALWYSKNASFQKTKLNGIKALRECKDVAFEGCNIHSEEFGWFNENVFLKNCEMVSEYVFLRSKNVNLIDVKQKGKYAFQYVKNGSVKNCVMDTKDAFWHAENLIIENCEIKGEYLGWYSKALTFINCTISGTQPFCYCRDLTLIDCTMNNADLCFEKSTVNATLTAPVISIKNVRGGNITLPYAEQIICDQKDAKGKITETEKKPC